jgi:serine/threonine protein kinase
MSNESLIGQRLANFRIDRLLGRGGMAEVYYGNDVNLQRPVAIKVIDVRFRSSPSYAERFISEARAVATWRHENIVQVYYAGKSEDLYFFVMEYIDGMDLDTLLREYADSGELMPHADVVQIAKAVASALDYAHTRNVIHRDVKPANVMISTDDRVVLMDFGLALDTQQGSIGEVFGTPHYVAPEQARRSADAVPQSDVYSLGIMLYEMLTGVVPFDDPSPTAVALQHLSMPPPSPRSLNRNLSQQVEDVLLKALEKTPEARYQTATEFAVALEDALATKPDMIATAELPPLPPGMVPPNRSMSGQTVSERVALNVQERPAVPSQPATPRNTAAKRTRPPAKPAPTPTPPATPAMAQRTGFRGVLLLAPVVLLVAVVGAVIVLSGSGNDEGTAATATPVDNTGTETAIAALVATDTEMPPTETTAPSTETEIPPSETAIAPTATGVPSTNTPEPPINTQVPPTPVPPTNTLVPPTATVPAEPTILYPNGRQVHLFWDDNSFYWYNPTGSSVRVSDIDFEALDAAGNVLPYAYDGGRWTIGFSSVESRRCVAIEILQSPSYLRPSQCTGYNSVLTLQRTAGEVFWLPRDGAAQFRVLWQGQEVGRCALDTQACEVRIP